MQVQRKTQTKVVGDQYCTLTVELRDQGKGAELSICGSAGEVMDEDTAREYARDYWISFFEDCPEEMHAMGKRFGVCFCNNEEKAADFVLDCDGEFHGLDLEYPSNVDTSEAKIPSDPVFLGHSWGQIRDDLEKYFPGVEKYFPYHLNGLSPICPCLQRERGRLEQFRIAYFNEDPKQATKGALDFLMGLNSCPDCGSKPGSKWWHVPLPQHVLDWFESL